jgi:endonuclease/exonuclease/phosphatase family metal-dependent hydrolase
MNFRDFLVKFGTQAPRFLGVVFLGFALLFSTACDKKASTPDWDTPGESGTEKSEPSSAELRKPTQPQDVQAPAGPENVTTSTNPQAEGETSGGSGLRFIAYNVENWLTMGRYVDRKSLKGAPKPDSEKTAVIEILSRHRPDIIGICEIGTAADLAEIQEKLKAAGLDLPNSHYTGGTDPTRHLGILSKYPIISTAKPEQSEYQLAGQTFGINRGILDATVDVRGKTYRFLGVHLKSKRDSEQGDQEAIRLNEARLLRRHVDSILKEDAEARLIVYGDFNDTRATPPLKLITGKYNSPTYLTAIPAKDSRQEAWTHYWTTNDIYSRIDFIMVSKAMRPEVNFQASKIIDDAGWESASDHRAVLAILK